MFAGPLGRSTFTPPKSSFDSPLYGLVSLRRSQRATSENKSSLGAFDETFGFASFGVLPSEVFCFGSVEDGLADNVFDPASWLSIVSPPTANRNARIAICLTSQCRPCARYPGQSTALGGQTIQPEEAGADYLPGILTQPLLGQAPRSKLCPGYPSALPAVYLGLPIDAYVGGRIRGSVTEYPCWGCNRDSGHLPVTYFGARGFARGPILLRSMG